MTPTLRSGISQTTNRITCAAGVHIRHNHRSHTVLNGTIMTTILEQPASITADDIQQSRDVVSVLRDVLPAGIITTDNVVLNEYAHDRSFFTPAHLPLAVVRPETTEQVQSVVREANAHHTPIFTRGKGSGVAGSAIPTQGGGIILSLERMNHILDINPVDQTMRVEAGVVTSTINEALADSPLFYAPDPASSSISSIGGNIATNAGGFHCVKYGVTRDSLLSLKVVLADGRVIETGRSTVKNVAGLDMTGLFTGSEGTLGIVVEATLRLRPKPTATSAVVAFFEHIPDVGKAVEAISVSGVGPSVFELLAIPDRIAESPRYVETAAGCTWMILLQADGSGSQQDAERLAEALHNVTDRVIVPEQSEVDWVFSLRKGGKPHPKDHWRTTGDVAVPLSKISTFLSDLERIAARHGYRYTLVAHVGDGNIHSGFFTPKVPGDDTYPEGLNVAHAELMDAALALGGTLTGEHGVGIELTGFLADQIGAANLEIQKRIKAALDPHGILNPGKWL